MYEREQQHGDRVDELGTAEGYESEGFETLRLGQDIRFVLAAVGGGGIRVARAVAARHLPYLETVAINCDPRVQEMEEFDRRICLGPESGARPETGGSVQVGGELARSAEPVLQRLFEGANFVTIVASLGGGTGTGALPYLIEAAARSASALKVFAIKPFECEGHRRALADRALARLHFLDAFVERQQRGHATLQVLDNEALVRSERHLPISQIDRYWGEVVARLIERELIQPAEAVLNSERMAALARSVPIVRPVPFDIEALERDPLMPTGPRLAPATANSPAEGVELTIEVLPPDGPLPPRVG
ncbi:MAG: hypothetical protein L3J95_00935 [Thermoplasmata archaeon]|nr:hypothetical protein [Thermoplasmata archaeon]MCI4358982.1 hypothetical protein [Thermoplasmata archaeon]